MTRTLLFPALCLLLALPAARAQDDGVPAGDLAPKLRGALVKLHLTAQGFDLTSPWNKESPRTTEAAGVLVRPGLVLTSADAVDDLIMVEVSVANSSRRYPAKLRHADPKTGLALVELTDEGLLGSMAPLPLGEPVRLDDTFDFYTLGQDNIVERYDARVIRADADGAQLRLRVKTTLSDSGNGQAAVRDGALCGLLVDTTRQRQEGTILGLETIRRYLADFDDGKYDGPPSSSMWIQPLLRDDLRKWVKLPDDLHGILITRLMRGRSGADVLRAGDVLLSVDGNDLDDEGKFVDPVHGRLSVSWLSQGRHYAGETTTVKVFRDGQATEVSYPLIAVPDSAEVVPPGPGKGRPEFLVIGGLVILELNDETGARIGRSPSGVILRRYMERDGWDDLGPRKRIVYVDHVLADESNKGFENMMQVPLQSVNDRPILELADITRALDERAGEYHVFRFEGLESDYVIPAARLGEIDARVAQTYKVTMLRNLRAEQPETGSGEEGGGTGGEDAGTGGNGTGEGGTGGDDVGSGD